LGGALVCVLVALARPVHAHAESEAGYCAEERLLYELSGAAVSARLAPATETEVTEHSAVTFTGESEWPLTFEFATSGAELSAHHYIDSGAGVKTTETTPPTYSFTSTKVTAEEGTVYWQAAFTRSLTHCNNESETFTTAPGTFDIKPRTLVVEPGEVGPPSVEPPGTGKAKCGPHTCNSSGTNSPAHLRVGITATHIIRGAAHKVEYVVSCTAACTGKTYFHASLVHRHSKRMPLALLSFGAHKVAIPATTGGDQRFRCRFGARALAKLRSLLAAGGEIRLQVVVQVTDAYGKTTEISRIILLRR
jgi:hypothetical protein